MSRNTTVQEFTQIDNVQAFEFHLRVMYSVIKWLTIHITKAEILGFADYLVRNKNGDITHPLHRAALYLLSAKGNVQDALDGLEQIVPANDAEAVTNDEAQRILLALTASEV